MLGANVRPAVSREDHLLEKAWHYWFFASNCGWTMQETDAAPPWLTQRMVTVNGVIKEIEREQRARADKE